jgi:hypothetical protein
LFFFLTRSEDGETGRAKSVPPRRLRKDREPKADDQSCPPIIDRIERRLVSDPLPTGIIRKITAQI